MKRLIGRERNRIYSQTVSVEYNGGGPDANNVIQNRCKLLTNDAQRLVAQLDKRIARYARYYNAQYNDPVYFTDFVVDKNTGGVRLRVYAVVTYQQRILRAVK